MTDDAYNAVITWIEPEEEPRAGPLAGKRLLVKDLIDTAGIRTTYGSKIYAEHVPERTASCVQRLLDAGVMQIVGVTDPLQVGFSRQAMVGVRTSGDARAAADRIAGFTEVDYVVITAGSVDLLVEVVCEDDDQLLDVLARIRAVEGVESTETHLYLGLAKQTYAWGTRGPQGPTSADAGL